MWYARQMGGMDDGGELHADGELSSYGPMQMGSGPDMKAVAPVAERSLDIRVGSAENRWTRCRVRRWPRVCVARMEEGGQVGPREPALPVRTGM